MSEYVSVTETAKLVRQALRREFPGVKFSVRSDKYSGGATIHVGWTDGPQTDPVDEVVKPYAGSGFDPMQDMKTSHQTWLYPDGTAVRAERGKPAPGEQGLAEGARLVHFMADYVFTERSFSPAYRAELERAVLFLSGEPGPFDGNKRYEFGIIPEGDVAGRAYSDYGSTLVYQLSRVDEALLESALRAEAKRRAASATVRFNTEHPDRTGFYVTVKDGPRWGALLGPYATKEAAEADVRFGKRLAEQVNDRAIWCAYGVTKVTAKPGTDLTAGIVEHLVERQMTLAGITEPAALAA